MLDPATVVLPPRSLSRRRPRGLPLACLGLLLGCGGDPSGTRSAEDERRGHQALEALPIQWTAAAPRDAGARELDAAALAGWQPEGAEILGVEGGTLRLRCEPGGRLVSPRDFQLDTEDVDRVRLGFVAGASGAAFDLHWSGAGRPGTSRVYDILAGPRTLELDLAPLGSWRGTIGSFAIAPQVTEETIVELTSLSFDGQVLSLARQGHGWSEVQLGATFRPCLHAAPPAVGRLELEVAPGSTLFTGLATLGQVTHVAFTVTAIEGEEREVLFERRVQPEQGWVDVAIPLDAVASRAVTLELAATAQPEDAAAVACWSDPVLRWGDAPGPDVFLYLADTLRADHTAPYSVGAHATPNISALAQEGLVYERCVAQSNWTKPSVVSMLTSTYLSDHGVSYWQRELPEEAVTLAESLRDAGYRTASFVTNRIAAHPSGLAQGFSHLYDGTRLGKRDADPLRTLPATVLPWIERHAGEPLFVYVHTCEPHFPYTPPKEFRVESSYTGPVDGNNYVDLAKSPEEIAHVLALYDGEIRHMDHSLGVFVAGLERLGRFEESIFVLTSDHGEAFLEHGQWRHRVGLYHHQVDVPLVLRYPEGYRAGERVSEVVRSIDIAPTLLSAVDVAAPPGIRGNDLLRGDREHFGFPVPGALTESARGNPPEVDWFGAYQTEAWKVALRVGPDGSEEVEVFHTAEDPGEREPLEAPYADEPARVLSALRIWQRRFGPGEAGSSPTEGIRSIGYIEELKALGYFGEDE